MKVVILAGGYGTRISEESISGPSRWSRSAAADPVAHHEDLLGPRAQRLRDLLRLQGPPDQALLPRLLRCARRLDLRPARPTRCEVHRNGVEPWRVTLRRHRREDDDRRPHQAGRGHTRRRAVLPDLRRRRQRHRHHRADRLPPRSRGALATVTAVQPPGRFGALDLCADGDDRVTGFREKPNDDGDWINGGFFVLRARR